MTNEYHFEIRLDRVVEPFVRNVIGDSIQITTDGGLRIYRRKVLVGAVKPSQWLACVLKPKAVAP